MHTICTFVYEETRIIRDFYLVNKRQETCTYTDSLVHFQIPQFWNCLIVRIHQFNKWKTKRKTQAEEETIWFEIWKGNQMLSSAVNWSEVRNKGNRDGEEEREIYWKRRIKRRINYVVQMLFKCTIDDVQMNALFYLHMFCLLYVWMVCVHVAFISMF